MSNAVASPRFRPALLAGVGGALTYEVIEGAPSAVSVSVYDDEGALAVTATPTISGSTLSYTVGASVCDEVGENFRARWTYTAGGVTYYRDQPFAVKKHVLTHQLSWDRFVREYAPLLKSRVGSIASPSDMIETSFAELLNLIRSMGRDPHRIMDASPLEPVLAHLVMRRIAEQFSFGSAQGGDAYQQWAEGAAGRAAALLTQAMAAVDWYDEDEDLVPAAGEAQVNLGTVSLSR